MRAHVEHSKSINEYPIDSGPLKSGFHDEDDFDDDEYWEITVVTEDGKTLSGNYYVTGGRGSSFHVSGNDFKLPEELAIELLTILSSEQIGEWDINFEEKLNIAKMSLNLSDDLGL